MPHSAEKARNSNHQADAKDKDDEPSHKKDKNGSKAKKDESLESELQAGKVQYESSLTTAEAVAYFESVIAGLKKGAVHFRHGGQALTLNPAADVSVEISASRKGDKQKVCFELRWDSTRTSKLEID